MPKENRIVVPGVEERMCDHLSRHGEYLKNYKLRITVDSASVEAPSLIVECFKCGGLLTVDPHESIGFEPPTEEVEES